MALQKGVEQKVPILLFNATGDPVTGVPAADVRVQLTKAPGTLPPPAPVTPVSTTWEQADPVNSPGLYLLTLSANDTDTLGYLVWSVQPAPSVTTFRGQIGSDTISELPANVTAIKAKTDLITGPPATAAALTQATQDIRGGTTLSLASLAGTGFVEADDNLRKIRDHAEQAPGKVWNEQRSAHRLAGSFGESDHYQFYSAYGKAEIVNQQLIIKDEQGNEVRKFNLLDVAGLPANFQVTSRTPVP